MATEICLKGIVVHRPVGAKGRRIKERAPHEKQMKLRTEPTIKGLESRQRSLSWIPQLRGSTGSSPAGAGHAVKTDQFLMPAWHRAAVIPFHRLSPGDKGLGRKKRGRNHGRLLDWEKWLFSSV